MTIITKEIRADFLAFADPATALEVRDSDISWIQSGAARVATIVVSEEKDFPSILYQGDTYSYRSFFACPHMSDLRSVAETQLRVMKQSAYVDSTVRAVDSELPGLQAIRELLRSNSSGKTSIIFLQGEAGLGKTTLLKQATMELAREFIDGATPYLALYVDAQNRSLARLDEAVALELQDIRAKFTYHALATLVRIGILVPIIDGFDELLGVRGYEDALSSLLRFLERLSGEGIVLTSARSSFYKFQNVGWLRNSSTSKQLNFEVTVATLKSWNDAQIEQAIELLSVAPNLALPSAKSVLELTRSSISSDIWQLFSTPFFVFTFFSIINTIAELSHEDNDDISQERKKQLKEILPDVLKILAQNSLSFFVVGLIRREIPKLKGRGDEPLLVPADHEKFLQEVAEEMWLQETRVLDKSSVEALLEIVVEGEGKTVLLEYLKGRAGVHPLLSNSGDSGLSFRHELFFSYFIAHAMGRSFEESDGKFYRLFGRASITPVIAEQLAKFYFIREPIPPIQPVLDRLAPTHVPPSIRLPAQRNSGEFVAAMLRLIGPTGEDARVPEIVFDRVDFRGILLKGIRFNNCIFSDVDLRGCKLTGSDFRTCTFSHLVVDTDTNFAQSLLPRLESIHGVVFGADPIFEPSRIAEILTSLGGLFFEPSKPIPLTNEQRRRVSLLRKLIRTTSRTFRFSRDDLENAGILQDSNWRILQRLLERYHLLETDVISRRGASAALQRFAVATDELEAGVDGLSTNSNISEFWGAYLTA